MSSGSVLDDVRNLAPRLAEREAADPESYPAESIAALQQAGVISSPLPVELGGRGTSVAELAQAIELIAAASPSTALLVSMPLGLAGIYGISREVAPVEARAAWQSQIEHVAADYRAGKIYAACNSEKGAGGSL